MRLVKKIRNTATRIHTKIADLTLSAPVSYRRFYVGVYYSIIAAVIYHSTMILFSIVLGVYEMAVYNAVSVLLWFVEFRLLRRHRPRIVAFLSELEVLLHVVVAIYFFGYGAGFQLLFVVIVITHFQTPRQHRWVTVPFLLLMPVIWMISRHLAISRPPVNDIDPMMLSILFGFNVLSLILFIGTAMGILGYFTSKALHSEKVERARADSLLLNILPPSIADRLKKDEKTIADGFADASIFFCDIVDFTVMSSRMTPGEVVAILNQLFSRIDDLLDEFSMEKIKTIGDAYMAACGIPLIVGNHAERTVQFALAVQRTLDEMNTDSGLSIKLRYGINSGPVVAGVIGKKKYIYDLWGDTVNTASRMESYGVPGRIQISDATREYLSDTFSLESRGVIEVKGKGPMETYLIETQ